jgi:hypothetical protein
MQLSYTEAHPSFRFHRSFTGDHEIYYLYGGKNTPLSHKIHPIAGIHFSRVEFICPYHTLLLIDNKTAFATKCGLISVLVAATMRGCTVDIPALVKNFGHDNENMADADQISSTLKFINPKFTAVFIGINKELNIPFLHTGGVKDASTEHSDNSIYFYHSGNVAGGHWELALYQPERLYHYKPRPNPRPSLRSRFELTQSSTKTLAYPSGSYPKMQDTKEVKADAEAKYKFEKESLALAYKIDAEEREKQRQLKESLALAHKLAAKEIEDIERERAESERKERERAERERKERERAERERREREIKERERRDEEYARKIDAEEKEKKRIEEKSWVVAQRLDAEERERRERIDIIKKDILEIKAKLAPFILNKQFYTTLFSLELKNRGYSPNDISKIHPFL